MLTERRELVRLALWRWREFIKAYADLEPSAAFDLQGDPPQYIKLLERESATPRPMDPADGGGR